MAWVLLFFAGIFEIFWALMLKQSERFTKPWPTVGFLVGIILSMVLLSQALKTIPVGTGYAIWTGIGAAGTAILGMVWLGESKDLLKLVSLALLIMGIIGMRLSSSH